MYSGVDGRSTSPAAAKLDAWPMASTSKEEKPTAPLLPAVQPKSTRKHSTVLARREWVRIVRRWICIISIQISAPGIVYYTYFYLFCIIPYFLLWNPGPPGVQRGRRGPGGRLHWRTLCAARARRGVDGVHRLGRGRGAGGRQQQQRRLTFVFMLVWTQVFRARLTPNRGGGTPVSP